jgi:hypothetical protein
VWDQEALLRISDRLLDALSNVLDSFDERAVGSVEAALQEVEKLMGFLKATSSQDGLRTRSQMVAISARLLARQGSKYCVFFRVVDPD